MPQRRFPLTFIAALAVAGTSSGAFAGDYPIGSAQILAGMEAAYLQAFDTDSEAPMRKAANADIHLETDIRAMATYRGDLSLALPGGEVGDVEGRIFTHLSIGQGSARALATNFAGTAEAIAFESADTPPGNESFAILAEAWYRLKVPLTSGGTDGQDASNPREHVTLVAGKIDPFAFFDRNAIANDEPPRFSSGIFAHNPLLDAGGGADADSRGFAPGALVQYVNETREGAEWMLSLGAFGAGGSATIVSSLASALLIVQAEANTRHAHLPGTWRAYTWTSRHDVDGNRSERKSSGMGLTLNQKVNDDLMLFSRYGWQWGGRRSREHALTLGGEFAAKGWGRPADSLGLALGAISAQTSLHNAPAGFGGDGSARSDLGNVSPRSEHQFEFYYRYRFDKHLEVTPDYQLIRRSDAHGGAELIQVIGVYAKVEI